jgi:hypothetical protein
MRPEKVCMSVERAFLLLIKPASKKPKAGTINSTSPVEISTQEVSPALIVIIIQNLIMGFTHLRIIIYYI